MMAVDQPGHDDVPAGVKYLINRMGRLTPHRDQFGDNSVLDDETRLCPIGEYRQRLFDPRPHGGQLAPAATASTSTRNSGRVNPETIINVEAGGGGLT